MREPPPVTDDRNPSISGARLKLAPASSGSGSASFPAGASPPWASLNSDRRISLRTSLLPARPPRDLSASTEAASRMRPRT